MLSYVCVALGSALGGAARFGLSQFMASRWGEAFPWATLLVNVGGSFIIGFLATLLGAQGQLLLGPQARHLLLTGVLGGFTTYSTFSLQTLSLARSGEWGRAGLNAFGTLFLCLLAVALGYLLASWLNARSRV